MLKAANQTRLWRSPSAISYRADRNIAELGQKLVVITEEAAAMYVISFRSTQFSQPTINILRSESGYEERSKYG